MKIYLISPVDLKYSYKGTELHIYEYAKYLREHGMDTQILVTENVRGYKELPGYRKILEPYKSVPKAEARCKEYLLPMKWHLFVYQELPRVGAIYFPYSIYDYVMNILTKPKGQKYIIGCHGMHLKMGHLVEGRPGLEAALNSWVNGILKIRKDEMKNLYCHALNREQAEYMVSRFNFKRENVFCIPSMVDTGLYKLSKNTSDKLRVVHVGGEEKSAGIVLDAVGMLRHSGNSDRFEFYFIGRTTEQFKKRHGKIENVHFLGEVSEREKLRLLATMDVMILPAYEVFPKSMLEGFASGLLIITSRRNSAYKDAKRAGMKIFIVDNGLAKEYVAPLLKLADQKLKSKSFNRLRRKNRDIAATEFDKEHVLKKLRAMFLRVASKPER